MSENKPNISAPAEDSEEETDWAKAKAFFDNLKTKKPRPVSHVFCWDVHLRGFFLRTLSALLPNNSVLVLFVVSMPILAAQTPVCCHHRSLLAHPLQHGSRAENLRGGGGGEVRGLSGRARERAPATGSCLPIRQGKVRPEDPSARVWSLLMWSVSAHSPLKVTVREVW